MPELKEGEKAPLFSLPSTEGREISLSEFKGKKTVILYFYPKDNTPGCTQESCDFQSLAKKFEKKDAVILGVSADSLKAHDSFRTKYKLSFPLLSDENKEVIAQYGVWKEKNLYGRKFMGIQRATFVINKQGVVSKIYPKVKVEGHAAAIFEAL